MVGLEIITMGRVYTMKTVECTGTPIMDIGNQLVVDMDMVEL
jgi:hypothetical protein